ncbi:MAG: anti-phage dCTP deaminase [Pseudohongiella sp.]|nr:anti-phage dCTP deaminase [Pseudohongiella sp.]
MVPNREDLPESGQPAHFARQPELVIGLVGPLGTPLKDVHSMIEQELRAFGYKCALIRISHILASVEGLSTALKDGNEYDRICSRMDAGSELRSSTKRGDILARLAISLIWDERNKANASLPENHEVKLATGEDFYRPVPGMAYVLDSLKNPDEVALLRRTYGGGFVLISAYAPKEVRLNSLVMRLAGGQTTEQNSIQQARVLIDRDHSEENAGDLGQRVSDVFAMADLVVDVRERKKCETATRRFFESFFCNPFHSPTRDEHGMYLASCAALRSLDMSRQVGAAILDDHGSVLGMGHNDIPKHGGGLYWDGDTPDGRDYSVGQDFSVAFRKQIVGEIVNGLAKKDILSEKWKSNPSGLEEYLYHGEGKEIWSHLTINSLLEFGRPLHAEMSAILDCTSKGLSVRGATLYCTTFPCHLCARLIIGAGIRRVVYIEPYHKSKTEMMYGESVEVDPSGEVKGKVNFMPFIGVAPQHYEKLFKWPGKRRTSDGKPTPWDPGKSGARIKRYVDTYIDIEALVIESANKILSISGLTWAPEKQKD